MTIDQIVENIQKNAILVSEQLHVAYDESAVQRLDGLIEQQRGHLLPEALEGYVNTLGSFLGECIIRNYGGTWQQDEEGRISVSFDDKNAVYPFAKVRKQFENGPEDSVYSFYTSVPVLFKKALEKTEEGL